MHAAIYLLIPLALFGLVVYLFSLIPTDPTVKRAGIAVALFVLIVWLIKWLMGHV